MQIFHRLILALGLAAMLAPLAMAEEQTVQQFLHGIYDSYSGENEGGVPLDNASLANYFTPELAALIKADSDAAAAKGEVPLLNGDPFIDAQEWKITNLDIKIEEPKPGFAKGTVRFQNYDRLDEITLDLLKLKQGWRIAEIYAPSGRLRELFGR